MQQIDVEDELAVKHPKYTQKLKFMFRGRAIAFAQESVNNRLQGAYVSAFLKQNINILGSRMFDGRRISEVGRPAPDDCESMGSRRDDPGDIPEQSKGGFRERTIDVQVLVAHNSISDVATI
jgi:hypothetical protein